MANQELLNSWAITLRHLAASRYYLPEALQDPEVIALWQEIEGFLHHNELGLALDDLEILGSLLAAPVEYWRELLLAAQNMGSKEHAARFQSKL